MALRSDVAASGKLFSGRKNNHGCPQPVHLVQGLRMGGEFSKDTLGKCNCSCSETFEVHATHECNHDNNH